jgi:hypothetical protein
MTAVNVAEKHFDAMLSNCSQQLVNVINLEQQNNEQLLFYSCSKLHMYYKDQFMSQT